MLKPAYLHTDLNSVTIQTDRLAIRPIRLTDTDAIFREFTSAIALYMNPRPATVRTETEAFVISARQELHDRTAFTGVLTTPETGQFLGCVGLHKLDERAPEFGIWLRESAHGQGLGREAIHALKRWADQHLDYDYLLYPVDKRNVASQRIPESLGGQLSRQYTTTGGLGQELILLEYHIKR